jgi:hypothetical protein
MMVFKKASGKSQNLLGSFLTIPNAFKQCMITLPIIHFALFKVLKEKFPNP